MSRIQTVALKEGQAGNIVVADLVLLTTKHVEDYDQFWQPLLREFGEDDKALSWRFKQQLAERQPNWECYAIESENLTQGLILLETQFHGSHFDWGQKLVYVETIMTAPWNRLQIQRPPEFKGVGRQMMQFAQQRSLALGYRGRVGLLSLPDAVGFYERIGMTRLELDPEDIVDAEENLPYFEYRALRQSEDRDYDPEP
ncbi:MAG: GNAT family N-acetyltransferase [Synechococcales cyanobacterium CRU_2_2]|nr:GNAT family N-acetyltransferase [Synechococcales cyanobacterium CRU_2_2]